MSPSCTPTTLQRCELAERVAGVEPLELTGWAGIDPADGTGDTGGCTAASAGLADCSPAAVAPAARAALATAGGTTVTQSPEAGGPCGTSAGGGAEDTHWLGCGGAAACICGASPHDCGSVGGVGLPAGGTTGVPARARESGGN